MERTGHRSIERVRSYKRTSEQQEQCVSDTLSLSNRQKTAPPTTTAGEYIHGPNSHHPHISATSNTMVMAPSMLPSTRASNLSSIHFTT